VSSNFLLTLSLDFGTIVPQGEKSQQLTISQPRVVVKTFGEKNLKISWGANVDPSQQKVTNGYGYATERLIAILTTMGHEVKYNDPRADVHFHFDQPHHFRCPTPGMYSIIYHPWESTQLLPPGRMTNGKSWESIMNSCDEVWTPSPLIADWYSAFMGINRPIYVLEHGVDDIWTKQERNPYGRRLRFLHVGGESARKGARETIKAFRLAFPNNDDVELNLKIISKGWNLPAFNRVNIINGSLSIGELVKLYHDNDVFVYPSYGEGFGLNPLQAMATGMPTITVPRWAPYKDYLNKRLTVDSTFITSPWPQLHPGKMLKPDVNDIVEAMRYTYHNWDSTHEAAQAAVSSIKEHYDWHRLTQEAFESLEKRLQK
jgi:glycosyltransferase involved in cell wall biosynthesis